MKKGGVVACRKWDTNKKTKKKMEELVGKVKRTEKNKNSCSQRNLEKQREHFLQSEAIKSCQHAEEGDKA